MGGPVRAGAPAGVRAYGGGVPFTGSHPAAVLPLLRWTGGRVALVPAALVIGSMAPDLPYYMPSPFGSGTTHGLLTGVLGADLVLGLAVFAGWQALLAPAAVLLAPDAVRRRLPADAGAGLGRSVRRPRALAMTLVSLAVGAGTHVVWDAFTHDGLWGAAHVPWLAATHGRYTGAQWAQVACSAFGLVAIAVSLLRRWRRTPPRAAEPLAARGRRQPGLRLRVAAAAAVLGAAVAGALHDGVSALLDGAGRHSLTWHVLTGGGTAGATAALLVAVLTLALARRFSGTPRRSTPLARAAVTSPGTDRSGPDPLRPSRAGAGPGAAAG